MGSISDFLEKGAFEGRAEVDRVGASDGDLPETDRKARVSSGKSCDGEELGPGFAEP